mmetsp:Transcript_1763/g.6139  ORF Transcript_1763/g.6139 Transcript_1763/m.6139 type:complete len:195 (+) Transcript_1763:117-701(+)
MNPLIFQNNEVELPGAGLLVQALLDLDRGLEASLTPPPPPAKGLNPTSPAPKPPPAVVRSGPQEPRKQKPKGPSIGQQRISRGKRGLKDGAIYCQWCGSMENEEEDPWKFPRYRLCNTCNNLPALPHTNMRFCVHCHKTVHNDGFSSPKNRTCVECIERVKSRSLAVRERKQAEALRQQELQRAAAAAALEGLF